MKISILLMAVIICLNSLGASIAIGQMVKSGSLISNEVWSGEVRITGDITVPAGRQLTIEPGTTFLLDDPNSPSPKLNILGTLKLGQTSSIEGVFNFVPIDNTTKVIYFSPYEVDTKILRDEFRIFRTQYIVLWTILTAGLIYAVANR